jgi:hypothetical protein
MHFKSYDKMPAPQTPLDNCVAHNGSLVPIPGREVMVQEWYQGGISVFDWTDASKPFEIAYYDRGPLDPERTVGAGSWSVYGYYWLRFSSSVSRASKLAWSEAFVAASRRSCSLVDVAMSIERFRSDFICSATTSKWRRVLTPSAAISFSTATNCWSTRSNR